MVKRNVDFPNDAALCQRFLSAKAQKVSGPEVSRTFLLRSERIVCDSHWPTSRCLLSEFHAFEVAPACHSDGTRCSRPRSDWKTRRILLVQHNHAAKRPIGLLGFKTTACRRGDRAARSCRTHVLLRRILFDDLSASIGLVGFEPTACRRGDRSTKVWLVHLYHDPS